jgi:hypothetical protein
VNCSVWVSCTAEVTLDQYEQKWSSSNKRDYRFTKPNFTQIHSTILDIKHANGEERMPMPLHQQMDVQGWKGWWWWWWGETISLNCGHQRAYCSSPGDIWAWRTMVEWSTEENSWFVHQSSLAILPAESCGNKQEEWAKRMRIWPCEVFLFILTNDCYMPWNLTKKGVLRILSPLKHPSPRPGFNPQTLGPMANTLTITPIRRHATRIIAAYCRESETGRNIMQQQELWSSLLLQLGRWRK